MAKNKKTVPKKVCVKCSSLNAISAKKCINEECGNPFFVKKEKAVNKDLLVEDWTKLQKGEKVQVYSNDFFNDKNGISIDIGNSGRFTVINVTNTGLVMRGEHGFCFQDMLKSGISIAGFNVSPPRIVRVTK